MCQLQFEVTLENSIIQIAIQLSVPGIRHIPDKYGITHAVQIELFLLECDFFNLIIYVTSS